MIRYGDKYIAIKIEPSYGVDPAVVIAGTDVVRAMNITRNPYAGPKLERVYDRSTMGSYTSVNASPHVTVNFEVELTAAQAAAGAPVYSQLLRACGFQESDVAQEANPAAWAANTNYVVGDKVSKNGSNYICIQAHQAANNNAPDVAGGDAYWNDYTLAGAHKLYKPRHADFESLRIEFWQNRNKQIIKGCRGNVELMFEREQYPMLKFGFTGRYLKEADSAPLANINISDYLPPLPVGDVNTPDFIFGAETNLKVSSLGVNLNNKVVWRNLINEAQAAITDRKATFTFNAEGEKISAWNLPNDYESHLGSVPVRSLILRHGRLASRYLELNTDGAQIEDRTDQNSDEVWEVACVGKITPEGSSGRELELRYF